MIADRIIEIKVLSIMGGIVRLGIEAPPQIDVHRKETAPPLPTETKES